MKYKTTLILTLLRSLVLAVLLWAGHAYAQGTLAAAGINAPPAASAGTATTVVSGPGMWLTFGLDRVPWLEARPFAGIPLWQFLASLIYIFLAFYVSKFLDYFIRERVQKWAAQTKTNLDDLLVTLVRGPVKVITFVILLHVGMRVYSWPEGMAVFLSNALKIIVACSITYVLLKAIDTLMGLWRERATTPDNEQFSKQLLPLLSKTFKVFVVIVAVLVTSQNLGFNVTGLIASLSIGGLAVGLAAQDTLANLFGAMAVLMDKPFKVGDRIQLDSVDGTVEAIGFRSTRVRNLDGHLVTIPNKTMGNATITNVSARPNIKTVMNIGVTYDTPAEKVQRAMVILEEVLKPHPKTADLIICFNKFESTSLNILVVHWWNSTDFKAYLLEFQLLNLEIKRRFDAEGISFAFPTQTVYLKQDSEWKLGGTLPPPSAGSMAKAA
ncbi:MAG: mechanosensitive ion channel family protein [Verrucomicrobiota bacterium]